MRATLTASTFFDELRRNTSTLHAETLAHPMVCGIGRGDVPEAVFRFYLEQDYRFLVRFVRVLALGIVAAPSIRMMRPLAELVQSTLAVEIDALARLYESFRGDPDRLDSVEMAPTCRAYTNHLLAAAHQHDLLLTLAAILPCQWGYGDIGITLRARGLPADGRFAAWICEYASDEYQQLVAWAITELNELAAAADAAHVGRARLAFAASAQYELDFWEMAWTRPARTP
jgi:thiaminase/transcriptional activator TenA